MSVHSPPFESRHWYKNAQFTKHLMARQQISPKTVKRETAK